MAADAGMVVEFEPLAREGAVDGRPLLAAGLPSVSVDTTLVSALYAEVVALRGEVHCLREEVESWKAEAHKQYCEAQYWRAMHQQALKRIAERDQQIAELKANVRQLRQQLFGRKTLKSLTEHWQGLTLFVEHPEVPMDNNGTERIQRGPVVGRKNYYGSGALWSGKLAAMLFSLFATLKLHGINPRLWLDGYLEACAAAGGKAPENAADFLPWNMSEDAKQALRTPFCRASPGHDSS